VQVAGLTLQNPIIAASGTCGYGAELHPFVDLNCRGAVVVKGVAQAVRIPVIGLGGIMTGEDALEFLVAGATVCQVGTASFVDPTACRKMVDDMARYLQRHHIATVAEICGTLRFHSVRD
jgi:dihydroorotate dehydrogenase